MSDPVPSVPANPNPADEVPLAKITTPGGFSINRAFNALGVRIVGTSEQPYFVAADVCKALDIKNTTKFVRTIDAKYLLGADDRARLGITTYSRGAGGVLVRNDRINLISEKGMYRLIMRSNSPLAADFQDFICDLLCDLRAHETEVALSISSAENVAMKKTIALLTPRAPTVHLFRRVVLEGQNFYRFVLPAHLGFRAVDDATDNSVDDSAGADDAASAVDDICEIYEDHIAEYDTELYLYTVSDVLARRLSKLSHWKYDASWCGNVHLRRDLEMMCLETFDKHPRETWYHIDMVEFSLESNAEKTIIERF